MCKTTGQNQARPGREPSTWQKHREPRPQPPIQNRMPSDAPKLLPVVGRPKEKDKKEGKVITMLSDFYRGRDFWGPATGGSGVGRRGHTRGLFPGLGTSLPHLILTLALLRSLYYSG